MNIGVNKTINKLYSLLRPLAKSNKYQLIYSQCKEGVTSLFVNTCRYSAYQRTFLQYITFYASLQLDIYMGDVTDIVLEDDIYADAYYYHKGKVRNKQKLDQKPQRPTLQNKPNKGSRNSRSTTNTTHIVFNKPKK